MLSGYNSSTRGPLILNHCLYSQPLSHLLTVNDSDKEVRGRLSPALYVQINLMYRQFITHATKLGIDDHRAGVRTGYQVREGLVRVVQCRIRTAVLRDRGDGCCPFLADDARVRDTWSRKR